MISNLFVSHTCEKIFLNVYDFVTFLFITVPPISCSQSCRCRDNSQLRANVIDCSKSRMRSLSELWIPNKAHWLVAKDNKIDNLRWSEEYSRKLPEVEHIDLANSSIESLELHFFSKLANLSRVRYLNLAGNELKGFNQDIQNNNLSEIYLSGNPIDCSNCDMFWFAQWLNSTEPRIMNRIVKDYKNIKCDGGTWNGTQVYKLSKEQMGCFPIRSIREL